MPEDRSGRGRYSFGVDPDGRAGGPRRRGPPRAIVAVVAVVSLLAAAGAYLYLYEPETVRPVLRNTPFAPPATVTHAYKWRDAEGAWQITGDPPPEGVDFEKITVRSDTNVLPAIPKPD